MRAKIKEYVVDLDDEIERCIRWCEENIDSEKCIIMETRIQTLLEVKNDLQSRLDEFDLGN